MGDQISFHDEGDYFMGDFEDGKGFTGLNFS